MIEIYTQSTHSKILYGDSVEDQNGRKLLMKSFVAKDSSLERDQRVLNGYMSPFENFYSEENDILPTGLIPYAFELLEKNNFNYVHKELRKFPKVNKAYVKQLINDEVVFNGKDGIDRIPYDYQKKSVLNILKNKGGIISLSVGSGKCLEYNECLNLKVDDNVYNKLKELNLLED